MVLKGGHTFRSWFKCISVMLYKKSGTKEVENIRDILILVGGFNFWGGLFIGDWFQTTMYTWLLAALGG